MKLKGLIIAVILFAFSTMTYAQSKSDKLFEKFSNNDGITTVFISKALLKMVPKIETGGDADISSLIGKLDQLEIYTSTIPNVASMMKKESDNLIKGKSYESLMTVKDGTQNVNFLIQTEGATKDNIKELLMVVSQTNECVLIRLQGNFSMDDIQNMINDKQKK